MIFIASDHRGFELKNKIIEYFKKERPEMEFMDLGPATLNPDDDYPVYVKPVVENVLSNPANKGILICANGVGVCMAAGKHKGIRAGLSWNAKHAESMRNDDDTNVLCLPAYYISEEEAYKIVETWISTEFGDKERYVRRLAEADL